ncbi:MAG: NAD(P)-binding domain-containing protein, partial [bacterium]
MKLFAVAGNPILSSCSPLIWNYSFKKKKIDAHYFRISADTAYDIIEMVKGIGLSGCNVTSPFKEDILDHIDKVEGDAAKIRAVNCIAAIGKKLIGYNTDVDGFYSALILNGFNPQDKKVVVVGAGGAAKAVIYALMKNGAYDVVIANRTYEKAKALSEIFNCRICSIDKIEKETKDADLLVSCVSTLDRVIKKDAIYKKLTVMDAKYNGVSTLLKDAEFAGCKIIDGKEWLICQAAFFFKDFFNELPVDQMKEALKKGHSKDLK